MQVFPRHPKPSPVFLCASNLPSAVKTGKFRKAGTVNENKVAVEKYNKKIEFHAKWWRNAFLLPTAIFCVWIIYIVIYVTFITDTSLTCKWSIHKWVIFTITAIDILCVVLLVIPYRYIKSNSEHINELNKIAQESAKRWKKKSNLTVDDFPF